MPGVMRVWLAASLLVLLGAPMGRAQTVPSSDQRLVAGRMPCAGDAGQDAGWRQLVWELMKRTSIEADMATKPVDPGSEDLFRTPLLIWSCQGAAAELDSRARDNLRRFLVLGGLLLIDDPAADPSGAFVQSIRRTMQQVFPDSEFGPVPGDHVLFKTFFLIDRPAGRIIQGPMEAIELDGRLGVLLSENDLLGAMDKDLLGNWKHTCEPGGEQQREMAFRMGINIVYYAVCSDYKDDRVHLPYILRRRKL
jgi:hypothetical protein